METMVVMNVVYCQLSHLHWIPHCLSKSHEVTNRNLETKKTTEVIEKT